ncbi:MAG: NYN domain-containing protein [Treponema sp.]|nr:NYN domain-containing protein [Treponema sp.]
MAKQRVIAYVDGFNLYYSSLKGIKYKWLDIWSMCQSILSPNQELIAVKYFTAQIGAEFSSPDKPFRQKIYLEALKTNPNTIVKLGYFSTHEVKMPKAEDFKKGKITLVDVVKTEEKGTDVNLAVQMAVDAVRDEFDYAMLFSNDSDMAYAMQITVQECKKKVGLYIARKAVSFRVLRKNASYIRTITPFLLASHQFPDEIKTQNERIIRKPKAWY